MFDQWFDENLKRKKILIFSRQKENENRTREIFFMSETNLSSELMNSIIEISREFVDFDKIVLDRSLNISSLIESTSIERNSTNDAALRCDFSFCSIILLSTSKKFEFVSSRSIVKRFLNKLNRLRSASNFQIAEKENVFDRGRHAIFLLSPYGNLSINCSTFQLVRIFDWPNCSISNKFHFHIDFITLEFNWPRKDQPLLAILIIYFTNSQLR